VGRTGFEPVTSSVSGNDVYCSCFPIFTLSCCAWSVLVRWRPSPRAAVVTQFVTHLPAARASRPAIRTALNGRAGAGDRLSIKVGAQGELLGGLVLIAVGIAIVSGIL
jgi:hypothetical protein